MIGESESITVQEQCKLLIMEKGLYENKASPFEILEKTLEFCRLLSYPENHVKVISHHYAEKQVNTRTHKDMADEVAHELVALPPFTAYVKTGGKYRIKTTPLPEATSGTNEQEIIALTRSQCCKERDAIDKEIQIRREQALKNNPPKRQYHRKSKPDDEGGPEEPPPISQKSERDGDPNKLDPQEELKALRAEVEKLMAERIVPILPEPDDPPPSSSSQ